MSFIKYFLLCISIGLSISCLRQNDSHLRNELLKIYKTDQDRPTSMNDKDFIEKWRRQKFIDSINLIRISKILDSIGFLGKSVVGDTAYLASFFVIQHSDLKNQEHYLPIFQKAADQDQIEWKYVAMMVDRIKVGKNEKQIYGTQLHGIIDPKTGFMTNKTEFYPIEDEKNVNIRRLKAGLTTIEEYAKQWGINYESNK
jgi:hypothetical protein